MQKDNGQTVYDNRTLAYDEAKPKNGQKLVNDF